jgi:hypothetical protein
VMEHLEIFSLKRNSDHQARTYMLGSADSS